MILLNDPRVAQVKCNENNEHIYTLREIHKKIVIDETKSQIGNPSELFCYAREGVIERLIKATELLPEGYQFVIKEAYRPLSLQKQFFEDAYQNYASQNSGLSDEKIYELTCQFVAPIKVAGHITGGAIDVTLMKNGKEIDMGSAFNDAPVAPENLAYTESSYISEEGKKNRKILIDCLEPVGFVNYPAEWWHWSYGDSYWGLMKQQNSCYAPVDEHTINR